MGNTTSIASSSPIQERRSSSSSPARASTVEVYSYNDMRAIFNAMASEFKHSLDGDQQPHLPPFIFPSYPVLDLQGFLQEELNNLHGELFIPFVFQDRWVSVMIYIKEH